MTNSVEMYAIKDAISGLFITGRFMTFGEFESAVANGVFYNQKKSAEKRIRECAHHSATFWVNESWQPMGPNQKLEVVPVVVSLKE